jgi:hypothetical protein
MSGASSKVYAAMVRLDTPDSAEVEYERYKETQKG